MIGRGEPGRGNMRLAGADKFLRQPPFLRCSRLCLSFVLCLRSSSSARCSPSVARRGRSLALSSPSSTITSPSAILSPASSQTPPHSSSVGAKSSPGLLVSMGFVFGGIAVMSRSRLFASWFINRFSVLFELRSLVLSVVVFIVLLALGESIRPSSFSFSLFANPIMSSIRLSLRHLSLSLSP